MRSAITKWVLRSFAIVAVMAVILAVVAMTAMGQRGLLALAQSAASSSDSRITIGKLDGSLFSKGAIDQIAISDRDGIWLVARAAQFDWNPFALMSGRIEINSLTVGTVEVHRRPRPSASSDEPDDGSLFDLPMIALAAKKLEVGDIVLGELLLGTAARLRLDGSADLVDKRRGLSAMLAVTRTDGPGGDISARLTYRPEVRQLEIHAAASEPAGGLLARLLDLPGLPAIAFQANGDGPLDQWRAQWSFSASGQPFIAGRAAIDKSDDRHWLTAAFEGYLSPVLPAGPAGLFEGKTSGSIRGYWSDARRFEADAINIKSAVLDLSANGGFDVAQVFVHGAARLRVSRADARPVTLPIADGGSVEFNTLEAELALPNIAGPRRISAHGAIAGLKSPWGALRDATAVVSANQSAPTGKSTMAFDQGVANIALRDIAPADERLIAALGTSLDVEVKGHGSPRSGEISSFSVSMAAVKITGNGDWDDGRVRLTTDVLSDNLGKFSDLADERLAGSAAMQIAVSREHKTDTVTLGVDGTVSDLGIGEPANKRALPGATKVSGKIKLTPRGGMEIKSVLVAHPMLNLEASGKRGGKQLAADVEARVADLSFLSRSLRGGVRLSGKLDGQGEDLRSAVSIATQDMAINGRQVSKLIATFAGAGPAADHRGQLTIDGTIDGKVLSGSAALSASDTGTAGAENVAIKFASAQLNGAVRKPAAGPPSGEFVFNAPNLADFSAFTTKPVSGSLSARAKLGGNADNAQASFEAKAARAVFDGVKISGLQASGELKNYLTAITGNGSVRIATIEGSGGVARDVRADISEKGDGLAFDVSGAADDATAKASGELLQRENTYAIKLSDVRLSKAGTSVKLGAPAVIEVTDAIADFKSLSLVSDGGSANVSGLAGAQKLDLKVALSRFPAAIANAFRPDLGLAGAIDGTVLATGTAAKPAATISLDWRAASADATRQAQLAPVDVSLRAEIRGDDYNNKLTVRGRDGLNVSASGKGRLSPVITTDQSVSGEVPLAIGNAALAARATRLGGKAVLDVRVSGPVQQPQLAGTINVSNGSLADPASGLKLAAITGLTRLSGDQLLIEQFQGQSEKGGSVSMSGTISGLTTGQPVPRLAIRLAALKFNDNQLLAGEVDADIALNGSPSNLDASGTVYIRRLDVTVPNQLPRSVTALDLKHVNAPPHLRVAERQAGSPVASSSTRSTINLDIRIDAADRIFVRGRGLDAQLGGGLAIKGDANRPAANGGFDLVRGRLAILGRQLDFKRGRIAFNGSLDPYVDFEASAPADGVVVGVNVYGPVSRPEFRFSSTPELPEDEVVAKLLFNKSLASLSPLQIAQLANEIDKIGGLSSGPGILDQLKSSVGVDVLDIGSDKAGGATVSAGSYLDDKTYVGVQQGTAAGSSRVIIDHDLTKTLKARGEVGADGNSKIGIGVEWDY